MRRLCRSSGITWRLLPVGPALISAGGIWAPSSVTRASLRFNEAGTDQCRKSAPKTREEDCWSSVSFNEAGTDQLPEIIPSPLNRSSHTRESFNEAGTDPVPEIETRWLFRSCRALLRCFNEAGTDQCRKSRERTA